MLQANNTLQAGYSQLINSDPGSSGEVLDNVLRLIRKNFVIILCMTLVGIAMGVAFVVKAPPTYMATAQIMLDTRAIAIFPQRPIMGDQPMDFGAVESQVQILLSKSLASTVVKTLNLANDPTFIEQSKGVMGWLLGLFPNHSSSTVPLSELDRSEAAVGALQNNLKVTRVGASYVIDINFRSSSPERAAQIANAIADAYVTNQMESRYQSLQQSAAWLKARLDELQKQQRSAEGSLVEFKAKNNIVAANGQLIKEDELNQLNTQLLTARAQTSEARARLDRIESIIRSGNSEASAGATVSETLTNPVITKLRDKYLEYANRESDLSARVGSNHFAVVNVRRQMLQLKGSINDELKKIAETYKSNYEIAKQRQDDLERAFAGAVAQSKVANRESGQLRELEGSARSYREIYDGLLQRYVQSVQEQSSPTTEARLITSATTPQSKSGPKGVLIVTLTSFAGLMLGVGIGVARQLTDRVFRTRDQVEFKLQTDCIAIVPIQKVSRRGRSTFRLRTVSDQMRDIRRRGVMWDTIYSPFSRYTESIRAIKIALDAHACGETGKIVGVTSALPNEGKSTIAGSLSLLAAHAGKKVILVDCDLRNPRLSRALAPKANCGFVEVLTGEKLIEQAVVTDPATSLAFLPAGLSERLVHSSELIGGEKAFKLFERLRERYELIVVDLSPIAPIVDVRSTTRFIDSYILIVEWGCTKMSVVEYALKEASGVCQKVLGVVLNKTPISSLAQYDGYLKDYYDDRSFKQYSPPSAR